MWYHQDFRWRRRGWLRPWVLGLLQEQPKNGAELMEQIERMSFGWRPSPGSLYPLLEELVKEGLLSRRDDGRYEVTSAGRESVTGPWEFFGRRPASLEAMLGEMRANVSYLEDVVASAPSKIGEYRATINEIAERLGKIGRRS